METKPDLLHLPWQSGSGGQCIEDNRGCMVADLGFYGVVPKSIGPYILLACNSHDKLLEACKDCVSLLRSLEGIEQNEGGMITQEVDAVSDIIVAAEKGA